METDTNQSGVAKNGRPFEEYIDKREAARRLGIKPRTLDQWLHDGRLPYYRIGHSVRMLWSECQAHLARTCRIGRHSM